MLVLAVALAFSDPFRNLFFTVLRFPYQIAQAVIELWVSLPSFPSLQRQQFELQTQLIAAHREVAQLRQALRELNATRELLQSHPGSTGLMAKVIARSTIPTQQTVLLNRGQWDDLSLGSIVIDRFGVVGRVLELHAKTCLVGLLTDPDSRVAGMVERSRETGLLIGLGQGRCQLIYLDAQADIEPGDSVVTAGLGGVFPKGLLLGKVESLRRDSGSGSVWATVLPAARLGGLEEVLCFMPEPSMDGQTDGDS